jgi:hypothetical protein
MTVRAEPAVQSVVKRSSYPYAFTALLVGCSAGGGVSNPSPEPVRPATQDGGREPAPDPRQPPQRPSEAGADEPAQPTSGSRLRAAWVVSDDGARQFSGWRDTQRGGEECSFGIAADGVLRCLPLADGIFVNYFGDSACSQRLFVRSAGCPGTPTGGMLTESCPQRSQRFQLSSIPRPTNVRARSGAAGTCVDVAAPESFDYFTGVEIDPTEFAPARVEVE